MASVWLALTLLVALFAPMVAPADAYSVNRISRVPVADPYFASDDSSSVGGSGFGALSILTIKEDADFPGDITDNNSFTLTLTPGVKWVMGCYNGVVEPFDGFPVIYMGTSTGLSDYPSRLITEAITDNCMKITVPIGATSPTEVDSMTIPLYVDLNGAIGNVTVAIESIDSGVTNNSYVFAVTTGAKATATTGTIKKIGETGEGEIIKIDEYYSGALTGKQTLNLELSDGFVWDDFSTTDIVISGGFNHRTVDPDAITGNNSQTLEISIDLGAASYPRGTIYIKTPIKALANAPTGIVVVTVTGSLDIDESELLIGWYNAPAPEHNWLVADVNGDGVVNGLDITAILTYFGQ